ncbi:SAM-dependent methyltransferase [Sorangium sp. So ce295]|uniref:SAM-dependent methyltransferase n=1 Tax=Sorangium sp. So ce295 TaxID=3133295 RepID=UPI003F63BB7A
MEAHLDRPSAGPTAEPVVIERGSRLSRSILWKLQRDYFERAGVGAWRTGQVPHYITSNPFVAGAYARIVTAFLRDLAAAGALAPGEPLTVIELGAGSGRFAYHFLQKLLAEPRIPLLQGAPIRYVMTDVSPANLAFWRAHPQLRPFCNAGVLDIARFDAERDTSLMLEISGVTLSPGGAQRPLVAIANYVFDGLPQDAWVLRGGVLHESRVTLAAPAGTGDLADPAPLDQLDVAYEHEPVDGAPYVDPDLEFLVAEYQQTIGEGALQLPIAALECVRALSRLAGGGFLLLSADKGYCHEEELLHRDAPRIARHGSISLDVDYHAIGRFVERLGGEALFPAHAPRSLCFGAFLLDAPAGGAETRAAFAATEVFGPGDWFMLKKGVEAAAAGMDLPHVLAALRAGGDDAKLFMDVFDRLLPLSRSASPAERRACFNLGRRLWELHYEIGEERDLAFHLGVWMRELDYREEAIRYFERSRATRGTKGVTAFNLAYCHLGQQRAAEALRCVEEAIAADPTLPEARALRTEIRAILRDEAA